MDLEDLLVNIISGLLSLALKGFIATMVLSHFNIITYNLENVAYITLLIFAL